MCLRSYRVAHIVSLSHTHALRKKIGRIFTLLRLVSHDWLSLVADLLSSPNSVLQGPDIPENCNIKVRTLLSRIAAILK